MPIISKKRMNELLNLSNDTKIKIKDGIYGALNAYNNNILKSI